MTTLQIGTINCATLRGKEEETVEMMKRRRLDVLGVSETRLQGEGRRTIHENYQLLWKGRDDSTQHGVGILVGPDLARGIERVHYINERIIGCEVKMKNEKVGIIQVYAPQSARTVEEKEHFYELLQAVVETLSGRVKTFVIGDWNGHVGVDREGYEEVIGAFGLGDRNADGERILNFCALNGLKIMNTFFKHKESHKWTWYGWNSERGEYTHKSMIDFIVCGDKRTVKNVKSIPSESMDADHRLVVAKVFFKKLRPRRPVKRKRIIVENLKDDEKRRRMNERIVSEITVIEDEGIENRWIYLRDRLNSIVEDTIGVKYVGGVRRKQTPWWTEEVKNAVKRKMKTFRIWMKRRTGESRQEYELARREAERVKKAARRDFWERLGEQLENDFRTGKKLLYSLAKNYRKGSQETCSSVKDKEGNLLTEPADVDNRWKEYFSELLNAGEGEYEGNHGELEGQRNVEAGITPEEVNAALKRMKRNKAVGCDGLPVEIFKEAEGTLMPYLVVMFNEVYGSMSVPTDWSRALICRIFKKGDRTVCSNFRGISLLPHIGKTYERILEARLRVVVEEKLGEWQYSYRPGRGTTDLIFALRMLVEKAWEWNVEEHMVFLDLKKAFDRVPRNKLWRVLEDPRYGVPGHLIRAIRGLYQRTESAVISDYRDSQWFEITSGVRQGSVLSPLLFIIYMDNIMKNIIEADGYATSTFAYADDVALISDSVEILQGTVNRWFEHLNEMGMELNIEKCEYMIVSRNAGDENITINNQEVKRVNNFKYLGADFNSKGDMTLEINERIKKYNRELNSLYPLLRDPAIPKKVKTTIYTTILRPVLCYGCETWKLTTKTKSKIQAAEMKALRVIHRCTRLDRIRNEVIRQQMGIESVLHYVERAQLRWFGHVMRMEEQRYPRKFYEWKPDRRRPVGRPRMRWRTNIEQALQRRGTSLEEVERGRTFEDRSHWRNLARSGN